ncbi:universal stress protein [Luteimonas sp. XNQY3]|nr:universal stress protein [Luteimonas sp. XNQY3]MCD9007105.1 universal stress protein [Luteimonas sp. XNQY3]
MTETETAAPVDTVLLATDLGFRCDRAAARAAQLAARHGVPAIAATAVEPGRAQAREMLRQDVPAWYRRPSTLVQAEQRLRRQLSADVDWTLRVAEGGAGDHLTALLDGLDDGALVVGGPVREGVLGPTVLGSTVDRLLRRPDIALLLVRGWVRSDYRRVLVASDFSEPSRRALCRARALFPDARFTLLHGFTIPMLGLLDSGRDEAVARGRQQLRDEGAAFLRALGAAGEDMELVVEYGDPARLAQQHVETFGTELVVVGTHGRGAMYELAVGSVARRIVTGVDADTLVVRGTREPVGTAR